ncbi:hypothetical protein LTR65_003437 [Meristemomyces frigidus]
MGAPATQNPRPAPTSLLLRLPPELRLSIWEFALVEDGPVRVTPLLQQPGLLRTCRQIREEAMKTWLHSNFFWFDVVDCDATLIKAFVKHARQLISTLGLALTLRGGCDGNGREHWRNLVEWCTAVRSGQAFVVLKSDDLNRMGRVVAAAHAITPDYADCTWQECEKALEHLRFAVGGLEPQWLL